MTRTCLACRTRKMRCDGATPECGPCSRARKPLDCTYSDKSLTQRNTTLLPKGAACLPCRRKKKKCDAERPFCNTCHLAGKEWECEYDEEIQQNLTAALVSRTRELEERLAQYESHQRHMPHPVAFQSDPAMGFNVSFPQWHPPSPSGSAPLTPQSDAPTVVDLYPSLLPDQRALMFSPSHTPTHNTSRPSVCKTTGLPSPSANLPCQDSYDLRTLFLNHQIQLGFYLRDAKWQAVRSGDFSGRVIHPAMIYLAQLVGCFLWKLHYKTDVLVISEDLELRNVIDAVGTVPPDPTTLMMVYTVLGEYLLFKRQMELGRDYLVRASRVLAAQDLQLAAPSLEGLLSSTEPDEDTKEYLSTLGQLLYIDKATSMVLRLPFFLDAEYDRQLRAITIMQPWLARHSAIVMRCKSIWILREATRLSQIRAAAASEFKSSARLETALPMEWYTQYWETLEDAAQHVAVLYPQMLQASLYSDSQQTLCLKVCIIVALAAQIELHRMPGYYHVESRQRAMCVIVEVIRLLRGLKEEDYALLEPTLGICFTIIANTLREDQSVQLELPPNCGPPQDALSVLIAVATQLSLKIPYVEPALHTLHEIAAAN